MRTVTRLLVPALIVATGVVGFASVSGGSVPTGTPLPISSFHQMVVDATHGHIFFSQGNSSQNGILVTDLSGQVVTTITGQNGVHGIAL